MEKDYGNCTTGIKKQGMRSYCFILVLLFSKISYSQISCLNEGVFHCQMDSSHQVYDYFNQRMDSLFCLYGRVYLMDCSPYYMKNHQPLYVTRKSTEIDSDRGYGLLDIFLDGHLLFRYEMRNGKIEGTGTIFYPDLGKVAYQATFKNGQLDGPLFCLSKENSEVIHSMRFKNGKPKKILYVYNMEQSKKEYRRINKRKYFRKRKCTGVVEFPFLMSHRKVIR